MSAEVPPLQVEETLALVKPDAFPHQEAIIQAIKDAGMNILQVLAFSENRVVKCRLTNDAPVQTKRIRCGRRS